MIIRYAEESDLENILLVWKENRKVLSIPFRPNILELIHNKTLFVVEDSERLVGLGGFTMMKKLPEVRIRHICLLSEYKNQHIGSFLLYNICEEVKKYNIFHYPIIAECVDGAENNLFFNKYSKAVYPKSTPKMKFLRYEIDTTKLQEVRDATIQGKKIKYSK